MESFIDRLVNTSEMGMGYGGQFSGSEFLPDPDSFDVGAFVLGTPAPVKSADLEAIVRAGARAVPLLLKHLDDARETKIPPIAGMMWTQAPDEYDYNRRTRLETPKGVNREHGYVGRAGHIITVGDLCFVALGQITNRSFNATRYQPSGGLMVNSPTSSKALCDVARADFADFTAEKHLRLLLDDLTTPDDDHRRIGACVRLAFYFPKDAEVPVLRLLAMPCYDLQKIDAFVRDGIYREKSLDARKKHFEEFITANGPQYGDGILTRLFADLGSQEADEEHRMSPPLSEKFDARAALGNLYGFKPDVRSQDRPSANGWDCYDEARFIRSLVHLKSAKVDQAVAEVFSRVRKNGAGQESLAIACVSRLAGKGSDRDLANYCRSQIGNGGQFDDEFKRLLEDLAPAGSGTTRLSK